MNGRAAGAAASILSQVPALGQAIALVLGLLVLVPWRPSWHEVASLPDLRVDSSFLLSMPYLLERGLQFGEQLVFTYGPLGILAGNVVPAGWLPAVLAARIALAVLFLWGWYAATSDSPAWLKALALASVLALSLLGWEQHFWLAFPLLAATLALRRSGPAWLPALLAFAAAAASLVKFNFCLVSGVCFLVPLASAAARRRCWWLPAAWLLALLAFWCAAGQRPLGLLAWVGASLDLASGYGEAMAKGFWLPYGRADVALFSGSCALLVLAAGLAAWRGELERGERLALLVVVLAVTFVCTRHAFGGNQLEQAASVLIALSLLVAAWPSSRGSRALALAAAAALWCASARQNLGLLVPPREAPAELLASAREAMRVASGQPAEAARQREGSLAKLRGLFPGLAKVAGTTDSLPDNGALVLAFPGLTYTPRPAYLSLNAHTARLAEANARFFAGEAAPRNVLYEVVPLPECVHDRLPASLDGPALREILLHYDLRERIGPFLWLERAAAPKRWPQPSVATREAKLGESIALPDDAVVWARIEVDKSLAGVAMDQVYKLPQIEIRYDKKGGGEEAYQILPRVAAAGFFVHPVIRNADDVVALQRALELGAKPPPGDVTGFAVRQREGPGGLWREGYRLTLETWR